MLMAQISCLLLTPYFPSSLSFLIVQVVAIEHLLDINCDDAAEEHRLAVIKEREMRERRMPVNGGDDLSAYYEQLEASVVYA